jgi:hypothetical protein
MMNHLTWETALNRVDSAMYKLRHADGTITVHWEIDPNTLPAGAVASAICFVGVDAVEPFGERMTAAEFEAWSKLEAKRINGKFMYVYTEPIMGPALDELGSGTELP